MTTAIIGFTNPDGTIKSIILNADGYPDHAGEMLVEHFNTPELASQLIDGGNLRSIDTTIETCEYYKDRQGEDWDDIKPKIYRNFGHYLNNKAGTDYLYLFQDGKWHLKE